MLRLQSKLEGLVDTAKALEKDSECGICMVHVANTALLPCGHCFCCREGCGSLGVKVCPMCNAIVENHARLFPFKAPLARQLREELDAVVTAIGAVGFPAPLAGQA